MPNSQRVVVSADTYFGRAVTSLAFAAERHHPSLNSRPNEIAAFDSAAAAAARDLGGREELVDRLATLAADPDAPAIVLITHHVEEIPEGFTHALILSEGGVVAQGLLEEVLTSENLTAAFRQQIILDKVDGRYFARRRRRAGGHRRAGGN